MDKPHRNYYKLLQVEEDATEEQIKKQFHRLAREHHPDKNEQLEDTSHKFKELNAAYQCLKNCESRRQYDSLLAFSRSHNLHGVSTSANPYQASNGNLSKDNSSNTAANDAFLNQFHHPSDVFMHRTNFGERNNVFQHFWDSMAPNADYCSCPFEDFDASHDSYFENFSQPRQTDFAETAAGQQSKCPQVPEFEPGFCEDNFSGESFASSNLDSSLNETYTFCDNSEAETEPKSVPDGRGPWFSSRHYNFPTDSFCYGFIQK